MTGNRSRIPLVVLSLLTAIAVSGCSGPGDPVAEETVGIDTAIPLSVAVVNYPLMYFAERIGGSLVHVTFPAPSGGDPAYWEPEAEQISLYQSADLILLNGASYAKWVPRVSLPSSRMVDTSAAFADRYISLEGETVHSHGDTGEHEHGEVAFTTWLDPLQAIVQAQAIRDALVSLRPDAAAELQQRFEGLNADLLELADRFSTTLAAGDTPLLLFSHPVYQYFIRRYEIDGAALHWEPEIPPAAEQWEELERMLAEHPARWMVWEGTPDPATAAELKRRGVGSVVLDPCGNVPAEGDYLKVMWENARRLADTLGPQPRKDMGT
jgi:zinc transport system substrate-binding protein